MHRQSPTMSKTTIASNIDKPFDVEIDFLPEITFYSISLVNDLAYAVYLIISEIPDFNIRANSRLLKYPSTRGRANTEDIAQRYLHPLILRYIDTSNTRHHPS